MTLQQKRRKNRSKQSGIQEAEVLEIKHFSVVFVMLNEGQIEKECQTTMSLDYIL